LPFLLSKEIDQRFSQINKGPSPLDAYLVSMMVYVISLTYGNSSIMCIIINILMDADRHMQTDRHRQTHADSHMQTDTCRQTHTDRHMETDTCRQTHADRHMQTVTCRQTHVDRHM
jgi:ABC-type nickel/cobalt efflux system permease component RcnA